MNTPTYIGFTTLCCTALKINATIKAWQSRICHNLHVRSRLQRRLSVAIFFSFFFLNCTSACCYLYRIMFVSLAALHSGGRPSPSKYRKGDTSFGNLSSLIVYLFPCRDTHLHTLIKAGLTAVPAGIAQHCTITLCHYLPIYIYIYVYVCFSFKVFLHYCFFKTHNYM